MVPSDTALSKVNWAVLPVCCVMMAFCYIDRSNVAYAALQLRQPPPVGLDFTNALYGRGSGVFFISYSLFQIPSNLILVRPPLAIQWLQGRIWHCIDKPGYCSGTHCVLCCHLSETFNWT